MESLIYVIAGCLSVLLNQRIDQQYPSHVVDYCLF